jgi:arylsulfatase A-like enzyme
MSEPQTAENQGLISKQMPRRTTFWLVLLTVLATLIGWYVNALITFAGNTYSYNNRFTEIAVAQHWFYLVWSNIEVLKGYFLVALIFTSIIYPLVLLWSRLQSFGKWGTIWRALLFCFVLYGFFIFRLMLDKPYFGDYSYFDMGWKKFGDWFGFTVQQGFQFFVLYIFPVIALVVCGGFYLAEIRKAMKRNPNVFPWPVLAPVAVLIALVVSSYGFVKEAPRAVQEPVKPKPKNILIIASDSFRADHLSCNGYFRPTTPNIDRIAAEGINFQRCFTPIASTLESCTTMFSSQYPHTHGIQHMFPNKEMVAKTNMNAPAFAAVLKENGYDTAVIGDWCACGFNELPLGFKDVIVSDFDNFKVYMSEVVYLHHQILPLFFDNRVGHWLFPKLNSFANYMTPDVVTNKVIERMSEREKDEKPFIIFAFYSCTHIPYKTPREYAALWTDPNYNGRHKHQLDLNVDEFIGSVDIGKKWETMPKTEIDQIVGLYDGCTRMFDDCVGRVMKSLDDSGLKDNTIVLVTGDHGDDLFEPNTTFGHGLTFNGGDQNNNIPCVMRVPGTEKTGTKIQKIVRSLDYGPTMLELVGIPSDPRFEGKSLVPYIKDPKADLSLSWYGETSYLFFRRNIPGEVPLYIPPMDETTTIDPEFDFHFVLKDKYLDDVIKTKERCLRTERFKLVLTPGQSGAIYRLYDTVEDKHCERDVKQRYPDVFERMKSALLKWRDKHQESLVKEIFEGRDEFAIQPTVSK